MIRKKEDLPRDIDIVELEQFSKDIEVNLNLKDKSILELYYKEINMHPLLTKEEEKNLFKKLDSADLDEAKFAKEKIINSNLKLVVSIAKKFQWCSLELIEIIQDGNMGLIKAVDRFDYTKDFKFSTYATFWIRQSINREINSKGKTIYLPEYLQSNLTKINKVNSILTVELKRNPTFEEIASRVDIKDIDASKVEEYITYQYTFKSLDAPISNNNDGVIQDVIYDKNDDPFETTLKDMRSEFIEKHLDILDEKDKTIITLIYGFFGNEPHTLEKVGNILNLSRERIRQRRDKAEKKLKIHLSKII